MDPTALADFHASLASARRILVIAGAGLSASSGLPTYRGAGSFWSHHDATMLCSEASFRRDPGLVWQYHTYFRQLALDAEPNAAHYALAEMAKRFPASAPSSAVDGSGEGHLNTGSSTTRSFMMLTQNIDRLSTRAGHPAENLRELHGSHFNLRCVDAEGCGYVERDNLVNPLVPALRLDANGDDTGDNVGEGENKTGKKEGEMPKASLDLIAGIARKNREILGDQYQDKNPIRRDIGALRIAAVGEDVGNSDRSGTQTNNSERDTQEIPPEPKIDPSLLPHCPSCKTSLLRPGVVWFGEPLPAQITTEIDTDLFAESAPPIDICLVVGTSGLVWPAAGYALQARKKGARVAVVNKERADAGRNMAPGDWVFEGDAAVLMPLLLGPVIGGAEGGGEMKEGLE